MLLSSNDIFKSEIDEIGILGKLNDKKNGIHVGLYWIKDSDKNFIHFKGRNKIEIKPPSNLKKYFGIKLNEFDEDFIPSLISLVNLIKDNNLGDIKISLKSIIYKGNKFDIESGKYIVKQDFENYINCGIFVLAILETYDLKILDWKNWPKVSEFNKNEYLQVWLEENEIPEKDYIKYYNFNKEIKGKHILASPLTNKIPAKYKATEKKSNEILDFLKST